VKRGRLLSLFKAGAMLPLETAVARPLSSGMTLLTAPLELGGIWGRVCAAAVIERMRAACLVGVDLLSDRQPEKPRVDVGACYWCDLAYRFGHQFKHVFCNSWERDAKPRNLCQWIEEALVESFSLRGLGLLADDWTHAPPLPNDAAYGGSI
jgi:hypothetical protein